MLECKKMGTGKQWGKYRMDEIVRTVKHFKALSSHQIAEIFFKTVDKKYRYEKCNKILKMLTDKGELKRYRCFDQFIYHTYSRRSTHIEDIVRLNNVLLNIRLANFEKLLSCNVQERVGLGKNFMVVDAVAEIMNNFSKEKTTYFIEYEDNYDFDKMANYEKLYLRFEGKSQIVVIGESDKIKKHCQKVIGRDNRYNLPYRVISHDEAIRDFFKQG